METKQKLKIKIGMSINKAFPTIRQNYNTGELEVDTFARITMTAEIEAYQVANKSMEEQLGIQLHEIKHSLDQEYQAVLKEQNELIKKFRGKKIA